MKHIRSHHQTSIKAYDSDDSMTNTRKHPKRNLNALQDSVKALCSIQFPRKVNNMHKKTRRDDSKKPFPHKPKTTTHKKTHTHKQNPPHRHEKKKRKNPTFRRSRHQLRDGRSIRRPITSRLEFTHVLSVKAVSLGGECLGLFGNQKGLVRGNLRLSGDW